MTREDLVWAAAYALAHRQNRAAIDLRESVDAMSPVPLPPARIDAMCRREADACVAVLRAGEEARGAA